LAAEKKGKKACKTHVGIIGLVKMIPMMKQVGCIVMTWPVHKLLPLLRGFIIPVSIILKFIIVLDANLRGKENQNLGPVVIVKMPGNVPMGPSLCVCKIVLLLVFVSVSNKK
jgi:hypothetical protein